MTSQLRGGLRDPAKGYYIPIDSRHHKSKNGGRFVDGGMEQMSQIGLSIMLAAVWIIFPFLFTLVWAAANNIVPLVGQLLANTIPHPHSILMHDNTAALLEYYRKKCWWPGAPWFPVLNLKLGGGAVTPIYKFWDLFFALLPKSFLFHGAQFSGCSYNLQPQHLWLLQSHNQVWSMQIPPLLCTHASHLSWWSSGPSPHSNTLLHTMNVGLWNEAWRAVLLEIDAYIMLILRANLIVKEDREWNTPKQNPKRRKNV